MENQATPDIMVISKQPLEKFLLDVSLKQYSLMAPIPPYPIQATSCMGFTSMVLSGDGWIRGKGPDC